MMQSTFNLFRGLLFGLLVTLLHAGSATATTGYTVKGTNAGGTGAAASAMVTPGAGTLPGNSLADCVFNWAEISYDFFSPASTSVDLLGAYYYRYYSGSQSYLALQVSSGHLVYSGPLSGNTLLDLGAMSQFSSMAGCSSLSPFTWDQSQWDNATWN